MVLLIPVVLAIVGGVILAVMIALNSQLYAYVSPLEASWIAHGTGALAAFLLLAFVFRRTGKEKEEQFAPWWAYLGGIPGALLVVLAVITVNSYLGITGTLVLSIVGQVLFGLLSDQFGWFGLERHPVTQSRMLSVVPILAGAIMIVIAKGMMT
jgi:transporter family-2 protein